jgi:tRNA pseudouridine38-40 synthase
LTLAAASPKRIAAVLEYDGGEFAGWQAQPHAPSVQQAVEAAFGFVAGQTVQAICAGRTDSGVHAVGQVIHFDTNAERTPRAWVLGANTRLPPSIATLWASAVDSDFHARFSALRRTYRYCILNRSARSALHRQRTAWVHRPLDADAMHAAAQWLLGEHDFSAFRSKECQSPSPRRRVHTVNVARDGDYVWLEISANAFLHHMVRNIVGTLLEVGCGDAPVAFLAEVLAGRDRSRAGITAPAAGLYLWAVEYPAAFAIASGPALKLPAPV